MRTLEALLDAIEAEAERAEFPVDRPVYEASGKSPTRPILYAGSLASPLCVLGRELGRQEVAKGEPLIGPAGMLVRRGLAEVFNEGQGRAKPESKGRFDLALLTNTVPYKPPGNKAYSGPVKARFRPLIEEFLADHWKGEHVITLGTEAFAWFEPMAEQGAVAELWDRPDRYERDLDCVLTGPGTAARRLRVHPLPHPSPLNRRYYAEFPAMLKARLSAIRDRFR